MMSRRYAGGGEKDTFRNGSQSTPRKSTRRRESNPLHDRV